MPILQLPIRPPRDPGQEASEEQSFTPVRVHAGLHGEFEEHELIHLLDSIDDERAKARFRESVYISIIIWLAVAWFLFYGPRIIFHQPYYKDPIALMKEHDQELTYIAPSAPPAPRIAPKIDRKTMEALRQQALARAAQTPPTPQPPVPQQPQEEAHNVAPPVPQPTLPLPSAPKPTPNTSAPLPAAPAPDFARNESPQSAIQNAMRGAIASRGSGIPSPPRPHASAASPQAGATILSDTQGVDFNPYMRRLLTDVQRNWDPLVPEEVYPPLSKRGITGIRFTLDPEGKILDMKLESPSGDVALDKAAWAAIVSEGQFPQLPRAFHGPDLELRIGFYYNEPIE